MGRYLSLIVCFWAGLLLLTVPATADKRVALVVGNSGYRSVPRLTNPGNDAKLVAATLRELGFQIVGEGPQIDLAKPAFDAAIQKFGNALGGADVALFYYAGHGMQIGGANYLVPIDANPTKSADKDFQLIDAGVVLRQMESAGTKLNMVLLDACRNNPFGDRGLRAAGSGLAQMRAPEGTLISFATQPGNVALDGSDGDSPYTKALVKAVRKPGAGIFEVFNDVGLDVKIATLGEQQPWLNSSPISGNFVFSPSSSLPIMKCDSAAAHWRSSETIGTLAAFQDHLARFPDCEFAGLARSKIELLKRPPATPAAALSAETSKMPSKKAGVSRDKCFTFNGQKYCE